MVDRYLIGLFILENLLTGDYYLKYLQRTTEIYSYKRQNASVLSARWSSCTFRLSGHLDESFLGRWIGRGSPISCPSRSPDFCLWSWFKNEVYKVKVDTRDALV